MLFHESRRFMFTVVPDTWNRQPKIRDSWLERRLFLDLLFCLRRKAERTPQRQFLMQCQAVSETLSRKADWRTIRDRIIQLHAFNPDSFFRLLT